MQKKVAFIINPKAGIKKKIDVSGFIKNNFPTTILYDIIIWKNKDDFESIKHQLLTGNYTIVVAVGGDGTVNQVAKTINQTAIALAILPFGSGNGLARSIGVPLDIKQALQLIATGEIKKIDSGIINNVPFFCTSGIGFDARIGTLFAESTKRGLTSYVKIVLKELISYKAQTYTITVDGQTHQLKAFLIAFANAGQYGNNFYIAPQAIMNDGILHVTVLKPFHPLAVFGLFFKILRKKIHYSKNIETYSGKKIIVVQNNPAAFHFDGEPGITGKEVHVSIIPNSLNVVCGNFFKW